jgi:ApaG protein
MGESIQSASSAVTRGIRVSVRCRYDAENSLPIARRYSFAYTVEIHNGSNVAVQLLGRHWIVTDSKGKVEEVKGPGVVGEQPIMHPGQTYEYVSHAVLATSRGQMRGTYRMHDLHGRTFDAEIAPFALTLPNSLN